MDLVVNIAYLEGVAGARFALSEAANLLHSYYSTDGQTRTASSAQLQFQLLQLTEDVCVEKLINTTDFMAKDVDIVGPAIYLLKLFVRQFGFQCLKSVSKKYQWVIPEGLRAVEQKGGLPSQVLMPFM